MLTIAIIAGPGINLLPTNDECIESPIKDRPGFTWPVFIYNDSLLNYTLKVFFARIQILMKYTPHDEASTNSGALCKIKIALHTILLQPGIDTFCYFSRYASISNYPDRKLNSHLCTLVKLAFYGYVTS